MSVCSPSPLGILLNLNGYHRIPITSIAASRNKFPTYSPARSELFMISTRNPLVHRTLLVNDVCEIRFHELFFVGYKAQWC